MDNFTYTITLAAGILAAVFTIGVIAAFFAFVGRYSREAEKKEAELKANGRQGEATIIRLPRSRMDAAGSSAMYKIIQIGLEIRVPGVAPYEIDKDFTLIKSAVRHLEIGKTIKVWIDPHNPRNPDSIVFEVE